MNDPHEPSPLVEESAQNPLRTLRAWQRLHNRLTILYGLTTLVALILLGLIFYRSGVEAEVHALQQRLLSTVTSLAASINAAAVAETPLEATEMTPLHRELLSRFEEVANQDADVETIYLLRPTREPTKLRFMVDYAKDGDSGAPGEAYDATDLPVMLQGFARPSVEDEPYTDEFGTTLSGYAPIITADGRSVGLVGVDVEAWRLSAIRQEVFTSVALVFGVAVLLLGLVAAIVGRNVRKPLSEIIDAAGAISSGNLNTRIGMARSDELGVMSSHIDRMAEQLQEREFIRETFGRYVSERVAKELLKGGGTDMTLGGEERVVTVLFSDLYGYSTISEHMPPARVVDMLNRYLAEMNQIVDDHGGCVIEFLGDAVFAVFGAPNYIPDHGEQAVRSAIEMRRRLVQLNQEWRDTELDRYWQETGVKAVSARIGIHSGRVVAGNLGSATRMKYAVIGDTVNVASRLETLNKELGTDILVSRDVYMQLPEDLTRELSDRGSHMVKGRDQPVTVYALDKPAPELSVISGGAKET
ncbi:MAG: HAMP domain-containing protein [Pseudomonadota bacterium]|nr:MAG: HAMP domain-containing protein [Pseudomonadota bacterium]